MKYKFKKGDLVVIPEEDNKFGWIDMIDPDDDMYTYKVRFSNEDLHYDWYEEDELEFDHRNNYKFKVGDVCVVTDTANCGYAKETVVEIIGIIGSGLHPATYPYKIRMHGASNSTYDLVDDSSLELLELPSEPSVGTIGTQVSTEGKQAVVEPSRCLPEPFNEVKSEVSEGRKYDSGKPMYNLLPADALEEVVKVLTYGAIKYNEPVHEENWRKVENPEQRYFAAMQRHVWATRKGETYDPESGISHYAHAITSLLFLLQSQIEQTKGE